MPAAGLATKDYQRHQVALRALNYADVTTLWNRLLDPERLDDSFPLFAAATIELIKLRRGVSADLARKYIAARRAGVPGVPPAIPTPRLNEAAALKSLGVTAVSGIKSATARRVPLTMASRNALVRTMGVVDKYVGDGGRELIRASIAADPMAQGWVRRTLGTCSFCEEEAREEHVERATADFPRHDHCGCQPEPQYASPDLLPEEEFVQKIRDMLKADSTTATEDQLRAMLADPNTKPLTKINIQTALDREAAEQVTAAKEAAAEAAQAAANAAERRALAVSQDALMDGAQYEAFTPSSTWSAEKKAAINAELRRTENGHILADSLEKFQDGGSISRLRTAVDKYLSGESLNPTSQARAEAIVDMLRNAPTEWAPDTLYRGMSVNGSLDNVLAKYEAGGKIDLNLTSFSSDRKIATKFQGMTAKKGSTRVMVELVGDGKRTVPIQNFARDARLFKEKEWISGGQYEVVESKKVSGGVLVRIRQIGTL